MSELTYEDLVQLVGEKTARAFVAKQVEAVQGWMALDLHTALDYWVDHGSENQGYKSWADWWSELLEDVRNLKERGSH